MCCPLILMLYVPFFHSMWILSWLADSCSLFYDLLRYLIYSFICICFLRRRKFFLSFPSALWPLSSSRWEVAVSSLLLHFELRYSPRWLFDENLSFSKFRDLPYSFKQFVSCESYNDNLLSEVTNTNLWLYWANICLEHFYSSPSIEGYFSSKVFWQL